jgi:hypothetical protein
MTVPDIYPGLGPSENKGSVSNVDLLFRTKIPAEYPMKLIGLSTDYHGYRRSYPYDLK